MAVITVMASTLTLVLAVALTSVTRTEGKCRFPEWLQRNDPWAGDYKDGPLVAYIKASTIKVRESVNGGVVQILTKECIHRSANKFVVRWKEDQSTTYQCLQFLKRSDNIVQLKVSKRFDRQFPDMCVGPMELDPFPLMQINHKKNKKSKPCPFVGGYNFYAYYANPNNSVLCSNLKLLMRMESECETGGGIVFDFRKEDCVPAGLPRTPIQRATCVAHWTHRGNTFIILQHSEQPDKWWCMRTSDPLMDLVEAYLWLQVVCDHTPVPSPAISTNHFKLQFNRRTFSTTCIDELLVCEGSPHLCNDMGYKHHCALSCGLCQSENQIGMCAFDESYTGSWMDSGMDGDYLIRVDSYAIRSPRLGHYHCLNLQKNVLPDKIVLLELFDNGCLPRYACAEMSKVNSSVMKFRLGKRHPWPLPYSDKQKEHICKADNFQMTPKHPHRAESRFIKERPPRLIVNTGHINEVSCGIPAKFQHGITFEEEGSPCGGCLYHDPLNTPSQFVVRPVNCSGPNATSSTNRRSSSSEGYLGEPIYYSCLTTFQFHQDVHTVVTKTASINTGMGQYLAWFFNTQQNKIKIMKPSEIYEYEANRHRDGTYFSAQFNMNSHDLFKCRSSFYRTTTTTTTPRPGSHRNNDRNDDRNKNIHYIEDRRTTEGPGGKGNKRGDKYTYFPDKGGKDAGSDGRVTPRADTSRKQNLKAGNSGTGGGESTTWHGGDVVTCLLLAVTSSLMAVLASGSCSLGLTQTGTAS